MLLQELFLFFNLGVLESLVWNNNNNNKNVARALRWELWKKNELQNRVSKSTFCDAKFNVNNNSLEP